MTGPSLDVEPFGTAPDGTAVERWTLAAGATRLRVLTWGSVVQTLEVPDRDGRAADVVLGLPTLAAYVAGSPYFGALVGRYANRIAHGRFELDGRTHRVPPNDGEHALHGGPEGFDRRVWRAEPRDAGDGAIALALSLTSPDGDQGFPGRLDVEVVHAVRDGEWAQDVTATTDAPTVVNLTNHAYWNLAGEGAYSAMAHVLEVPAARYVPVGPGLVPLGGLADVAGTPLDFRLPTPLGARVREAHPQLLVARGYDHTLVLDGEPGPDGLRRAARLTDPGSGRVLELRTTEPGVQLHSANFLDGSLVGPSGRAYRQGDAVCLETHHFPDSPNSPEFPSTVLRPGETHRSRTVHRFSVDG